MYTDLHCHMLPNIDDGAKDLAQSLAMARTAVEDGIRSAVMTPHHLNGVYRNRSAEVLAATATGLVAATVPLMAGIRSA